jgi:lysozyme family protein
MTIAIDQILDGILDREGEGKPPYLVPGDAGGRTAWGISERSHPEAWQSGPPSRAQARDIYTKQYVYPFYQIPYEALKMALIDDAVLSGISAAIKRLQIVLGVVPDGIIGIQTIAAIQRWSPTPLVKAYVVERAIRLTRLVQRRPSDLPFLTGWITRILSFLP